MFTSVEEKFTGFKKHFCMPLAAPTDSGKSYLLKKFLRSKHANHYQHIFILCPSVELNDDFDEFENNKKFKFYEDVNEKVLNDIINKMQECKKRVRRMKKHNKFSRWKCPSSLILLDDCIDSGVLEFGGIVDRLAERGRHFNATVMIAAQRISSISRSIRLNASYFLIFTPYSIGELEQFMDKFVPREMRKAFRRYIREVIFSVPYNFILVDNSERDITRRLKYGNADELFDENIINVISWHSE